MKINAKLTMDLDSEKEKRSNLFNELTKLRRSQQISLNNSSLSLSAESSRISDLESNIWKQTELLKTSSMEKEQLSATLESTLNDLKQ